MIRPKPVVLVTLSGVGVSPMIDGNALKQASMPTWKHLVETYPTLLLDASGASVGLPSSASGSSEAGHRTIGLGKPWKTSDARAECGLSESTIYSNIILRKQFRRLAKEKGSLHLIGLLSSDTSYSNQRYVETLAAYAHEMGIERVFFHIILDGINAPHDAGLGVVRVFASRMHERGLGEVASICGRAWGMDHDGYWDRTARAFRAIAYGESEIIAKTAEDAIQQSYDRDIWDDQLEPIAIASSSLKRRMSDGDAVLFWNIRPYGMRQLLKSFALPTIESFDRPSLPDLTCLSLTEYDYDIPVEVVFPAEQPTVSLGRVLSQFGLRQLRIAEAERFAHVTVFLNGLNDEVLAGEDRVIIPSPAVSSYEHSPGMSMNHVAEQVIKAVASNVYDCIFCNLCGPDIAASTGHEDVTIKSCELLDKALHRMIEGVLAVGGVLIAVGDSGHAEALRDQLTNEIKKTSSSNPVPCIVVGSAYEGLKASAGDVVGGDLSLSRPTGTLADIAPTMLHILSIPIPKEMIGKTLV